jgi:hypothetical protein
MTGNHPKRKIFHTSNIDADFAHQAQVLLMLFAVFVAQAGLPDTAGAMVIKVSMQAVALLLIVRLGTLRRGVAIGVTTIALIGVAIALVGWLFGAQPEILLVVDLVLVAAAPFAVFRSVTQHRNISMATVMGAISLFLLIGLFFASVHHLIYQFDSNAYTVSAGQLEASTFQYFSFITLTTVGFGDVLAVTNFTRMLVAMEAVLGQVFLVTVVALVVGNLGRARGN